MMQAVSNVRRLRVSEYNDVSGPWDLEYIEYSLVDGRFVPLVVDIDTVMGFEGDGKAGYLYKSEADGPHRKEVSDWEVFDSVFYVVGR